MEIIISHESALEYWRLNSDTKIDEAAMLCVENIPASIPSAACLRDALPSGLTYPVSLIVDNKNYARNTRLVRARVYKGATSEGCFIKVYDGAQCKTTVCSPQLCFFQMADKLPLIKLIELGFELCGSYSLFAEDKPNQPQVSGENKVVSKRGEFSFSRSEQGPVVSRRTVYGHPRLTSVKSLKAIANKQKGIHGQKKAQRALRYIIEGSASPMESILVMMLTLPHQLGGYGLPAPVLNKRIDRGTASKQRLDAAYYICDLFWPEANFAIEYDSDYYHSGTERFEADSTKRFDLNMQGITLIGVTKRQIENAVSFESLANFIAKKLGKRIQYDRSQFIKAHNELRDLLL